MYQPDNHALQVIRGLELLLYWVFYLVSVLYNKKYTRGQRLNAQWSPDQIHAIDFYVSKHIVISAGSWCFPTRRRYGQGSHDWCGLWGLFFDSRAPAMLKCWRVVDEETRRPDRFRVSLSSSFKLQTSSRIDGQFHLHLVVANNRLGSAVGYGTELCRENLEHFIWKSFHLVVSLLVCIEADRTIFSNWWRTHKTGKYICSLHEIWKVILFAYFHKGSALN